MKLTPTHYVLIVIAIILIIYVFAGKKMPESKRAEMRRTGMSSVPRPTVSNRFRPGGWPWRHFEGVDGCMSRAFWHGLFGDGTIQSNSEGCLDYYSN